MGYGSEIAEEMEIEFDLYRMMVKSDAEKGIWTMRDGTRIPVEEMTTSHLQNTIRFLKRKDFEDLWFPWICRMEEEVERRRKP